MTLEQDKMTVRLSLRDWIAIAGIAITILGGVLTAYLHHDRLLMQIVTQQAAANERLNKIETRLERTHP
jgi:hypothetical protein